uniref:uncharacterized protein LOC122602692 isoform X1 n=1 Tax=Erigeron canadensis TaxID=72917 RepID=UPI001CB8A214|nr:uncharacterized protein LOC122602692 isoform X1 [Erigeron canadensis]
MGSKDDHTPSSQPWLSSYNSQALQQLLSQFGLQVQSHNGAPTTAYYANRGRGRGGRGNQNYGRRSSNSNRSQLNGGNRNRFAWASNQNTVFGTCNRCGIGHIPILCPNRDPSTYRRSTPPQANYADCSSQENYADYRSQANYADHRSQASTSWLTDTGCNHHVGVLIFQVLNTRNHIMAMTDFMLVMDKSTHHIFLTGPSLNGLYSINLPSLKSLPKVVFSAVRASPQLWHQRLGHPHSELLKSMLSRYRLSITNKCSSLVCDSCLIGKSSKLHLSSSNNKSSRVLDPVFCDVWGPPPIPSSDGHRYFLLCVDHFSSFMWIYPLKQKSDVFLTFKQFFLMVERQFQTKLKFVQTDWGGEFRNIRSFFASVGIIHRLSCPHTSEQNGTVEQRHLHVVETGLTLLAQSHVPTKYWHFAYDTAIYLINRMPSRTNHIISPFEQLFHTTPHFSFLRVFGCRCYPHLRPYHTHKMDFRSTPSVFLGYSTSHHGYRCLELSTDRIYICRHVRFDELSFPFTLAPHPPTTSLSEPYVSYPNPVLPFTTIDINPS